MNQLAKDSAQSAHNVNKNANDLIKMAENLKNVVSQFKV